MTSAQWTREFVARHPEYNQDSVVTDRIAYDLLERIDAITAGNRTAVLNNLSPVCGCQRLLSHAHLSIAATVLEPTLLGDFQASDCGC